MDKNKHKEIIHKLIRILQYVNLHWIESKDDTLMINEAIDKAKEDLK